MLFFLGMLVIVLGISVLSFVLMKKVFALYRNKRFMYFFWSVNFVSLVLSVLVRADVIKLPVATYLMEFVVLWFMSQFFAVLLLPVYYAVKKVMLRQMQKDNTVVDEERRKFIKGLAVSLPIATMGISAYGTFYSSRQIQLLHHEIKLSDLDQSLKGFKIGQISDAHVGLFFSAAKLRDVLKRLMDEKVDVLVITGDLIDEITALPEVIEALNEFAPKFPQGIYFSWGNHEYFRDFAAIEASLAKSNITILRNQNVLLMAAVKPLYLIGVDYPWAKDAAAQQAECRQMLNAGLADIAEPATKILLSHHPMFIDYAYSFGIDLCLTGHTHGGQIAFFGQALLPVRYKYMRGMYKQENQYGYVSTGAGSWFPFRMGCPAEITVFTLQ